MNNAPKYQVGERIRVILDCEDNTLSFEKNYEFLGVAFKGESMDGGNRSDRFLLFFDSCL